jgi:hypothetical protein
VIKPRIRELVFAVTQDIDGGYVAECLTESVVTQGDVWKPTVCKPEGCSSGIFL